jgi:ribosomal protein L6P/L9E
MKNTTVVCPCGWRREASKEQLPEKHSHLCRSFHIVAVDKDNDLLVKGNSFSHKCKEWAANIPYLRAVKPYDKSCSYMF